MNILFQGNILEPYNELNQLGITLSAKCKCTSHIDNICTSVSKKCPLYVNSNLSAPEML